MSEQPPRPGETSLESWKTIAAHLRRDVRTVKRWETSEGLPVHRHRHLAGSTVYAYASELDAWRATRRPSAEPATASWLTGPRRTFALACLMLLALFSSGGGRVMSPVSTAAQDRGMAVRQLWSGPDVDTEGTSTPDGRFVTFIDWSSGNVGVRNLATGENRYLTDKGSFSTDYAYAEWPVVSPDGTRVAHAWYNNGLYDLRIVPLAATTPEPSRLVYRNEDVPYLQPHAWSPNGTKIATVLAHRDGTYQIALISVVDGIAEILKSLEWREPQQVSFSPDGRYLAYDVRVRPGSPDRDIFVLSIDGRQEVPLGQQPAIDYAPVWTPDGRQIVFASDRRGTTGLWVMPVADGKPHGAPELLKSDMGAIRSLGFSRDGSYYYGVRTPTEDVYTAELNPQIGELSSPPTRFTERFLGSNLGGAWSSDGRQFAYFSRRGPVLRGPGNMAVVIRSLDTGEERELFTNLEFNRRWPMARWFPDGRSLLLSTRDNRGRGSLHRMDAQTGTVTPVLQSTSSATVVDLLPSISPDGRTIYYFRSSEGTEPSSIMRFDVDTGRQQELFRSTSLRGNESLALSRDGKRLAFVVNPAASASALQVLPVGGGEPRGIFRAEQGGDPLAGAFGLEWTHDDRFILFVRRHSGRTDLWCVSPDGGVSQKILSSSDARLPDGGLQLPRVHPDGRRLTFTAGQRERNEVWVMQNFLPAQKAAR